MRIGLLGLGTVGSAVARRLLEESHLLAQRAATPVELAAVAVRDPGRERRVDLRGVPLTADAGELVGRSDLDLVVELIGGEQPAALLIERLLSAGVGVVTANKAVIARHGPRLARLAAHRGIPLRYEAAVGGAVPIVSLLRESLLADRVTSIECVINGTSNLILGRMSEGLPLAAAVAEARAGGYAEADPSADVDGIDAAAKLSVLTWLALGIHRSPDGIPTTGIREVELDDLAHARRLGHSVKLIASARATPGGGVSLGVGPTLVPHGHPLDAVAGVGNAVVIRADLAGRLVISGAGAGGEPTASAVVSDIVAAARQLGEGAPHARSAPAAAAAAPGDDDGETAAYLRLEMAPAPEAPSVLRLLLEDRGVEVEQVIEPAPLPGHPPTLLCLTGAAPRSVLVHALETLDSSPAVARIASRMDRLLVAG